jgi:hypothetical protein
MFSVRADQRAASARRARRDSYRPALLRPAIGHEAETGEAQQSLRASRRPMQPPMEAQAMRPERPQVRA